MREREQKQASPPQDLHITNAWILIIDDGPDNIRILDRLLSRHGYQNYVAKSGKEGLQKTAEAHPDLILLDVNMPDIDGFEICRQINEDPDLWDIPVIFITGRTDQQDIIRGFRHGGADYIIKPFNGDELLARVETQLKIKKYRDLILVQKKELEKMVTTQDRLYSIISHDLKTSLDGIRMMADFIRDDVGKAEEVDSVRKSLQLITQSARTAVQTLDNLLDWSQIQMGAVKPAFTPVDLHHCIQLSIDVYTSYAARKNVTVRFDSPPIFVPGDKEMLSIGFRNLLSNAIKYSHKGGYVDIAILEDDQKAVVSIRDYGIGMSEEIQSQLFDSETRPTRQGTDKEQSTGLGLLLCKDVAEMHGGKITVSSKPGEGTTFFLALSKVMDPSSFSERKRRETE